METIRAVALFFSGFLIATGLMVFDEILTLALYCKDCGYAIPLLGVWAPYDAEGFAWVLVLIGFIVTLTTMGYTHTPATVRENTKEKEGERENEHE